MNYTLEQLEKKINHLVQMKWFAIRGQVDLHSLEIELKHLRRIHAKKTLNALKGKY